MSNQQQFFKALTNSVNDQMQQKLYQMALYSTQPNVGIDPKSTALAMGIARMYYADSEGKFHSMKLGGILCLIADRRYHSKFLRLYDINSNELLFQTELYINFSQNYKELNDYFFTFPIEKVNIGIQFANVHDASVFHNLIKAYSFKGENINEIVKEHKSKIGNHNYDITKPYHFERKEHAGWDPNSETFKLNEVPEEIKLLLKKAGFKKKHLKKKETALSIYEILLRDIDIDTVRTGANQSIKNRNSGNINRFQQLNESMALSRDRNGSVMNFGIQQTGSNFGMVGGFGDHKKGKFPILRLIGTFNENMTSMYQNTGHNSDFSPNPIKKDDGLKKAPPIPPPLMGIPPPPMTMPPIMKSTSQAQLGVPPTPPGMALPPPPIPGGHPILPPGPHNTVTQNLQSGPVLSFTEQLAMQSQNLKKVQETQINNKVKNLSESQQMKITMNLAVVLEQRKKAMLNDDKQKDDSDDDSDEDENDSDGSAW